MAETKVRVELPAVVLHTRPALKLSEEQFFEFCRINRDWRIERTAEGDLEIMPPTGGETSSRNFISYCNLAHGRSETVAASASTPTGDSYYPVARCVRQTLAGYAKSIWRDLRRCRNGSSCRYARTS